MPMSVFRHCHIRFTMRLIKPPPTTIFSYSIVPSHWPLSVSANNRYTVAMDASLVRKYFFSALLVVALGFGVFLFWPFLKIIILALICAVLLHPLHRWIERQVKFPALAAFLTLLCFILIICIPLYFITTIILGQFQNMYQWLIGHGSLDTAIRHISTWLHHLFPSVSFNLQDRMTALVTQLPSTAGVILATTFTAIISSVFMLIALFYFLKD